jgi:choline kinase
MTVERAIIFAAGKGSRLGPYTKDLPKTLLNVGNMTIFDRSIIGLQQIGVKEIVVVTGYAGSILRKHALTVSSQITGNNLVFRFVENNELDIGNIYSFWLTRHLMDRDFILLNSDVVFDYEILRLLASHKGRSVLVVDDLKQLGEEEMKVRLNDGAFIKEISKEIEALKANGEYIGLMKLSSTVANDVAKKVEQLIAQGKYPLYYEDALRLVAREQDSLVACSTNGLPWTEIDTIDDMDHAKRIIIPQIENLA